MKHKVRFSSDPAIRGTGNKSHLLNVSANGQSSWETSSCWHLVSIQRQAHKMSMESCPPSEAECGVAVWKLTELSISHLYFQQSILNEAWQLSAFQLQCLLINRDSFWSHGQFKVYCRIDFTIFTRKPLKCNSYIKKLNGSLKQHDSQTVLYIQMMTEMNQIMSVWRNGS